jgi:hypothetical protein
MRAPIRPRSFAISLTLLAVIAGCDSSRRLSGDGAADASHDAIPDALRGDATRDSTFEQMALGDATVDGSRADANLKFPAVLEGLWLIGWSGGMNHFSWVRLGALGSGVKSKAWINAGKNIFANAPLLDCSGETSWFIGAALHTAYVDLPSASCLSGKSNVGWVFESYRAPDALAPGALLMATVKDQATLNPMSGYKFPDDWCDAALTHCKSPF